MQLKEITCIGLLILNCSYAQECTPQILESNVNSLVAKLSANVSITESDVRSMLDTCSVPPLSGKKYLSYQFVIGTPDEPEQLKKLAAVFQSLKPVNENEDRTLLVLFNKAYQKFTRAQQTLSLSRSIEHPSQDNTNVADMEKQLRVLETQTKRSANFTQR